MRTVQAAVPVNANVCRITDVDLDTTLTSLGFVPDAVKQYVAVKELGDPAGVIHQTVLTLTDLPQTILDASSWAGTEIYDFPAGRISVLGCTASLAPKTTTTIATTIKSGVAGAVALGTAAADSIALTGTEVDLLPSTVTANSTTINVAAAAVGAALAAPAQFDGTSTAKKMFLNSSVAAADIDGNGALAWTGTITITWINLGDY